MKIQQVVVTGQRQVELVNSGLDKNIGDEEILIRTECTFISAGTELANYTGKDPDVFRKGSWCAYPWHAGYANVGIVEDAGVKLSHLKGQRVFTLGHHESYTKVSKDSLIVTVPDGMGADLAAASRMAGVATSAMVMAEHRLFQPVVAVFGLGMVGNLAAQSFRILGAKVVGIDPVPARRDLAVKCGIRRVFAGGCDEDVRKGLMELAGSERADICIEATGLTQVLINALASTENLGQLILLGSPRGPREGDLTKIFSDIHLRNVTVHGALEWCLPTYPVTSIWGGRTKPLLSLYEKQRMIFDWISDGRLLVEPLISHRLPPSNIKDAYEGLLNAPSEFTGVVLDWREGL